MTILQLTPGAGAMYCGNCLRDNALVTEWRRQGHDVTMVPLYLPLTLDEDDQSADTPVFFGGVSVYLSQKSALFRHIPAFFKRVLASRSLLNWASGRAAKTRPADVAELTLSMLRGEHGLQADELESLIGWLKSQPRPEVVCLSNALLLGMAHRLKAELKSPLVCTLQGEDWFLDALPEPQRTHAWQLLRERAEEVDLFVAPSRYFADLMTRRLQLKPDRVRVVPNGILLDGYSPDEDSRTAPRLTQHAAPVLGFFARMCREKGLDTLVEAFIHLKRRNRVPRLKLHIGGSCGPADEAFVKTLRQRLAEAGGISETVFSPNLNRAEKIAFLKSLSVFSVPARYGEAFGLYAIEAMAAGVPVVAPQTAAFPELVESTGGGVLCAPEDPVALAEAIEPLLLEPERGRALGEAGRKAVCERFSAEAMADAIMKLNAEVAWLKNR